LENVKKSPLVARQGAKQLTPQGDKKADLHGVNAHVELRCNAVWRRPRLFEAGIMP
jgi:hypothetical protein